jgi:hypothetical protein
MQPPRGRPQTSLTSGNSFAERFRISLSGHPQAAAKEKCIPYASQNPCVGESLQLIGKLRVASRNGGDVEDRALPVDWATGFRNFA